MIMGIKRALINTSHYYENYHVSSCNGFFASTFFLLSHTPEEWRGREIYPYMRDMRWCLYRTPWLDKQIRGMVIAFRYIVLLLYSHATDPRCWLTRKEDGCIQDNCLLGSCRLYLLGFKLWFCIYVHFRIITDTMSLFVNKHKACRWDEGEGGRSSRSVLYACDYCYYASIYPVLHSIVIIVTFIRTHQNNAGSDSISSLLTVPPCWLGWTVPTKYN